MKKEFYDTADVMRELGVSKQMVNKYVQSGKLKPIESGKHYNIYTRAEFERFIASRTKGFRKRADNE